jgi:hypothetical protein
MKSLSMTQAKSVAGGSVDSPPITGSDPTLPAPPPPMPTIPDFFLYNGLPTPTHAV